MLDSSYTAVGLACVYYNGTYYWVQEFGNPTNSAEETEANDSEATVDVEVASSSISSMELSVSNLEYTIGLGDTDEMPEITATVLMSSVFPYGRTSSLSVVTDWQIADDTVASISDGVIYANEVGTTELTTTVLDTELVVTINVLPTLADCTVTVDDSQSYVYTGSEIEAGVIVMYDDTELTPSVDYTVTYTDNVDSGTATAEVTGIGAYTGTNSVEFTIEKADIGDTSISTGTCVYDGTSQEPEISIIYNDMELVLGTDYTIECSDNVNAGTAIVTVTGNGNYEGTCDATFEIEKAEQTVIAVVKSYSVIYGGTTQVNGAAYGEITYSSSDESILTVSEDGLVTAVGAGEAYITITASGDENHKSATMNVNITVEKADQTVTASIEEADIIYKNTSQITASGIGDITYSSSDEGVATVSETGLVTATGAGTATITVAAAGDDNVNAASTTIDVTVEIIYTLGDVNQDGDINYLDAMMVLRSDAMLIELDDAQFLAGDVNQDGVVSSLDAIKILRMDAGLITEF